MIHFKHQRLRSSRNCTLLVAAAALLLTGALMLRAQERTTLRKVEIVGLQRLSADQVITATGLKVGQMVDRSMLDGAANKLMRSGWFKSVDYRVQTTDNDTTIVFEVAEKVAGPNAGAAEILGQVSWAGNAALTPQDLSNVFGLRAGNPAPQSKIDEGLDRIRKAYARRGYVSAQLDVTRNLDGRRANYQFTIREGQQHRMGVLTVTGLNPTDTRSLRGKWTLASGATFDDSYVEKFSTTVIRPFIANRAQRTGVRSKFEVAANPDAQKQTVDVIITFK